MEFPEMFWNVLALGVSHAKSHPLAGFIHM